MKRTLLLILTLATLSGVSFAKDHDRFPKTIVYRGISVDLDGNQLSGTHRVNVRVLDKNDQSQLAQESHQDVVFENGRFELTLGQVGDHRFDEIARSRSEFLFEFTIDGVRQGPLVRVLPAGHSEKSRLAVAGLDTGEGKLHSKGFTLTSRDTAVQAATLSPSNAGTISHADVGKALSNPFHLPMRGPVLSLPLASLPSLPNRAKAVIDGSEVNPPRHERLFDSNGVRFGTGTEKVDDALAANSQQLAGGLPMTPAPGISFPGLGNTGFVPPDPEGAIGPNHYVQMVNVAFAVFDKSGAMLSGPTSTNSLWSGFGGACESDNNGDAIALYDQQVDRWVLTQFAITSALSVCFAVSTSPDPLGTYNLYELPAQRFPDYYKLGVWPDAQNNAYFMGTNSGTQGAYDVYAVDRENMLLGNPARAAQFFQSFPNLLMPADHDGNALPPAGAPGLLYTIRDGNEPYFNNPPNDSIDLYEFDVDWDTPGNTTLTLVSSFGPPDITDFNWTICGFFVNDCLDQPGTANNLDSISWWPMQRFQYRNFGSYETLLGTWTVDTEAQGDHAAPRWFELRRGDDLETVFRNGFEAGFAGEWSVFQEGTHSPDGAHRWVPSISMNGSGDIALSYSITSDSDSIFPSIRYAGRRPGDPPGALREENSLIEGGGAQTGANRWGDYSSMDVDPADDCTFWMTTEYIATTGGNPWVTQIGNFKFPGCLSLVASPSAQELCTTTDATNYDLTLADGFAATTNLSVTGCPAGAVCGFSVNPVVNPTTMSQLQLTNLGAVTGGNYSMTVTGTDSVDPLVTADATVSLNLFDAAPASVTLMQPADLATMVSTVQRTFTWSTSARAASYTFELATDAGFSNIIDSVTGTSPSYTSTVALDSETSYFWRVRPTNICGNGTDSAVFSFTTAVAPGDCPSGTSPVVAVTYDFESGEQGWTHNADVGVDTWALSSANPSSGVQHWHADDVIPDADQRLTSPAIVLPSGQSPLTMQFMNFQNMEANGAAGCWDGGVLEISTDGGNNFTQIQSPSLLTDPYDGPFQSNSILFGEEGWCGNPQPYLNSVVDIDAFAGQTVQFRFRTVSDEFVAQPGWDIDDVVIQGCQ